MLSNFKILIKRWKKISYLIILYYALVKTKSFNFCALDEFKRFYKINFAKKKSILKNKLKFLKHYNFFL